MAIRVLTIGSELAQTMASYFEIATKAREALENACRHLELALDERSTQIARCLILAQAKIMSQPLGLNLVAEACRLWGIVTEKCSQLSRSIPVVQHEFTADALFDLHLHFQSAIERTLADSTVSIEECVARVDQYMEMERDTQTVTQELTRMGEQMIASIAQFNEGLDQSTKATIQGQIARSAKAGYLGRNDPARIHRCVAEDPKPLLNSLIPNLAVHQAVARVEPATLEQVEETTHQLTDTNFSLTVHDQKAPFHLLSAIAKQHNLEFAIIPSPDPSIAADAWNQAADFAMENDVLTESSIHLLGSDCQEYHMKGISLHLRGDLKQLESDPSEKYRFIVDVKAKLAAVHRVEPSDIVIIDLAPGTITVIYTVPRHRSSLSTLPPNLKKEYQKQFGVDYLRHEIHPSFAQLNVNPAVFATKWNRDFRDPTECPEGERRGEMPYTTPAGWIRYGMSVLGRFKGGDGWLGICNCPGEWAVVYHGTATQFLKSITETPLRAGRTNLYGYGIYCSPNPTIAKGYTNTLQIPKTSSGSTKVRYMFMCRANVSAIHRCSQCPCPLALILAVCADLTWRARTSWMSQTAILPLAEDA
jgi:hypothetical protein